MITIREYFGPHKPDAARHVAQARELLAAVTPLLEAARGNGVELPVNPKTGTLVSGEMWGGYRTQACTIGALASAHKTGEAVDVYDPVGALDTWITDERLERYELYREHPEATLGWSHLSTRAPKSGSRTFRP